MHSLIGLVVGTLLLLFGRQLFWLFVGLIGFAAGLQLAPLLLPGTSEVVVFIAAVLLGLAGAVLAILLQKVAIALAGFVAGGYIALHLILLFGGEPHELA